MHMFKYIYSLSLILKDGIAIAAFHMNERDCISTYASINDMDVYSALLVIICCDPELPLWCLLLE